MFRVEVDCSSCRSKSCCKDGVDVDLKEAKRISRLELRLKKPWFEDFFEDKNSPSGWAVGTVVRNGRCVFQDKNKRCRIYKIRPQYCVEFPLERGKVAPFYKELCEQSWRLFV